MKGEDFKTEDWLRLALKAGKMSVWHWDVKTNTVTHLSEFVEASEPETLRICPTPRIREILGVGEVPYTRLEGVHAEDIPLLEEAVKTAIAERREYQVVYRNICDETTRWIEERGVGTYDRCGDCVAVKGLIADITDRRKPEEELRTSEKRYRNVVESQTDLICRFLPDTTLTFVNNAYCQYFGKTKDELVGTSFLQFLPEDARPSILEQIEFLLANPSCSEAQNENHARLPDGRIRWVHWANHVIIGNGDGAIEFQGVGRDVTARKELEEHLMRSERDFSTLVENSTDIIYRLDRSLRCLYVGPAVQWVLGVPVKDFIGRTPREVGPHSLDCGGFEESCNYTFETAQRIVREFCYDEKCYSTRIIPEFSLDGAVESILCIDQDITERKRIEKELRLLSARLLDIQDEERRRIARELHDSTAQNLFAISLSLAHVSQQAVGVEVKDALVECASLCETSLEEIRTLAYLLHPPMLDDAGLVSALRWYIEGFSRRSGVAVTLIVGEQQMTRLSMEIETDLFRIVQECLANVHRHSGSETAIVRVDEESGQLVLQIEDRGRGMPGWDGVAAAPGSLGVGILGMRERLSQLGGRLEVKSSSLGTTIAAIVPLVDRQPAQRPRRLTHERQPMSTAEQIEVRPEHRRMASRPPEPPSENTRCA